MPIRSVLAILFSLLMLACNVRTASAQATQPDDAAGNAALAERVAHLSQLMLSGRAIVPETLRQSAALLDAAMKLNPDEVRYARLAAEAYLQLHDTDGAINAYRAIWRIDPADQVAQIRLMDLFISRMETADQRIDYLQKLTASETIPAEVRAHAAYLAALVRIEKSQPAEAIKLLDESLALYPLSPESLKKKWELAAPLLTPRQRVEMLLTMLKSNPAQPGVMADLGGELGALGVQDLSLSWYASAINLGQAVGRGIDEGDITRYLAQLIIADQENVAEPLIDRIIAASPGNVDAAFLGMLIQRRGGNAEKLAKAKSDAQNALSAVAAKLHQELSGADPAAVAATQEAAPSIDVAADIAQIQQTDNATLKAGYASLLADFAWYEIFFNGKSAEAEPYLAHLRQLVPSDSPILARLEGWQFLTAGQIEEAKSKLSASAEHDDPLARLGMIEIQSKDPANKDQVKEASLALFQQNSTGLVGAILADALRDRITPGPGLPIPAVDGSNDIRAIVDAFPKAWLDFIGRPSTIYTLRADPLKVNHVYAEPILAQVTVKNVSPFDITIGTDGALRPDLWFDLQLRGLVQQGMTGVTFDRIWQRVVLKPGESITQRVRLDQGQLTALLQSNPSIGLPLYFSMFTNPITLPTGISPGPGGQRVQFSKVVSRAPTPLNNEQAIDAMIARIATDPPEQRMQLLELLGAYGRALSAQPDEKVKAKGVEMLATIRRTAAKDPISAVRAYASYNLGRVAETDEQREPIIAQLLASSDWSQRLLGLIALHTLEPGKWKQLATPLAQNDPDETVKKYASAVVEFADNPAALQPATTQPAVPPDGSAPSPSAASGGQ